MNPLGDLGKLLNPQQLEAVQHTDGPLLIFAGAGSGKTRVITYRAANMIANKGVPARKVLCVTFTNKAAGEMRHRLEALLGSSRVKELWAGTFHGTGARLLRRYHEFAALQQNFAIYDDADQRSVMNRVLDDLRIDERLLQARTALDSIDRWKQEVLTAENIRARAEEENDPFLARLAEVYANYELRLRANNAVDFSDLLMRVVQLLEDNEVVRLELQDRFRYLMVDEFQDTNAAQYRIVRALVGPDRNLCVVGDDDQAIYRWRGADVRNIQYFKRDFPDAKIVKLEENYRSTGKILRAANAVVQRLHQRESKVLFTRNGEGDALELYAAKDERDEALRIALAVKELHKRGQNLREVAVFYRIHAQSRPLEEALRAANVPYTVIGGMRFYERAEIKDVLAYLRLLLNPNDDVGLLRVINNPPRGIGKTTLDRVQTYATERQSSLWRLIASGDLPEDVGGAARKKLAEFYRLVSELRRQSGSLAERPSQLAALVLDRSGYLTMLRADTSIEAESRLENLRELIGSMEAYEHETAEPTLADYLERVTLAEEAAAREEAGDKGKDRVSLMTVHTAKGLEFDTVFLTGLEEGMFPYKGTNPGADREEIEEERRLAYVAITRARRRLVLTYAKFRNIFGSVKVGGASRFLYEIPEELLRMSPGALPGRARPAPAATSVGSERPSVSSSWDEHSQVPSAVQRGVARAAAVVKGAMPEFDDLPPPEPAGGTTSQGFRKGMRVKHPKFGVGRVEAVEPGAELKVTVYFPGIAGSKKVLAEFLSPL